MVFGPLFFPGAFELITLPVPARVLVVALRSVAEVAALSPNTRFFLLVWGFLFLFKEFSCLRLYSLAALVVWPFSLRMPLLRLDHRLRLLALWVFAGNLILGCPCMCVCV